MFFCEYNLMEEVQKLINPKCNIALSAPCKTDNLNSLLGWVEELQTVRKQYQEAEMRLTELQSKYRVAKKTARQYILWADGKEQHILQEWQCIVVGLQNVLQVVQAKALAALTDSAAGWTGTVTARHTGTVHTQLKVALLCA